MKVLGVSPRRGELVKIIHVCRDHMLNCDHAVVWKDFFIIGRGRTTTH